MLQKIVFKQNWRCFKKDDIIKFHKGLNLLVGDQGSGKSSIFELFLGGKKKYGEVITFKCNETRFQFFDYEKMNPRVTGYIKNKLDILSMWSSHGIINKKINKAVLKAKENSLILMDEPDTALSPRSILELVDIINKMIKKKCQLVIATHNPLLILNFNEVLSLEHRKWMKSTDFLEEHIGPNKLVYYQ